MAKFHVIIPAAGSGSRMRSETPKQYLPLLSRPLITWCLDVFYANPKINQVHLALHPQDEVWSNQVSNNQKLNVLRTGGETRAQTVLNTLQKINADENDWILVHDAARPGLTHALLNKLLTTLQDDAVGGLLAVPLADTLKRADMNQRVQKTESREALWQAQTPQMFQYGLLKRALIKANANSQQPTYEAQAIEFLGFSPNLVVGELRNLKITYPQDLLLAETILAADMNKHLEHQ
jgi:2-C-methyl-D-erythritol 4-phosphate cytidylyltransferase